ncbi:hypothetical protein HY969_00615 [Candidatus Kaiserbacteria bacterium]|nr:hypothetical protein [Candidatus Kaiserbacteria bacterium]
MNLHINAQNKKKRATRPHFAAVILPIIFLTIIVAPLKFSFHDDAQKIVTITTATAICGDGIDQNCDAEEEVAKTEEGNKTRIDKDSCWYTTKDATWGDYFECMWYSFISFFGSIPITLGVWFVTAFGQLFNWTIDITITRFAEQIYKFVEPGVNTAWQVFRDVANIVIIGMFTFIAISMILGIERFGAKKMVARVLIIAVLINFSLLFSKLIIDTSNFTAKVFYDASDIRASVSDSGSLPSVPGIKAGAIDVAPLGISGRFLKAMGITSFKKTTDITFELAKAQKNAWISLVYGLVIGIMLFLIAGVFLYAVFLLVARAVLLIVLMMVSSLAFASYLIPKYADAEYGWSGWWQALLKNAVFAPILMMFLWATLAVAEAFASNNSGGTLGQLISNPTSESHVKALFQYLLVLGLLFVAIKFSSSFSSKAGVTFAKFSTGTAASLAAGGVGIAGRQLFGRLGASAVQSIPIRQRQRRNAVGALEFNEDGTPVMESRPDGWVRGAFRGMAGRAATASFDPRKVPGVKSGARLAGLDVGKEQGKGGFVQTQEDKEKKLIERETAMAKLIGRTGEKDRQAQAEYARRNEEDKKASESKIAEMRKQAAEEVSRAKDIAEAHDKEKKSASQGQAGARQPDAAQAERERAKITRNAVEQGVRTAVQESGIRATVATPEQLAREQARAKQEGESTRREETAKIQKVAQAVGRSDIDDELAKKLKDTAERFDSLNTAIAEEETRLKGIQTRPAAMPGGPSAQRDAYIEGLRDKRYLSFGLRKNTKVAGEVGGAVKMGSEERRLLEYLKASKAAADKGSSASPPPPPPATPKA